MTRKLKVTSGPPGHPWPWTLIDAETGELVEGVRTITIRLPLEPPIPTVTVELYAEVDVCWDWEETE
jgi:hypothetical protein